HRPLRRLNNSSADSLPCGFAARVIRRGLLWRFFISTNLITTKFLTSRNLSSASFPGFWCRAAGSCRRGWTQSTLNKAQYENAAVIAPTTRPFELRADQPRQIGRAHV